MHIIFYFIGKLLNKNLTTVTSLLIYLSIGTLLTANDEDDLTFYNTFSYT